MEKKEETACFTGHRTISGGELPQLQKKINETIVELIGQGISIFISGGALGFDTVTAQAALQARVKNPNVKLIMALPCDNQELRWHDADKQTYRHLLDNADEVVYVSEKSYFNGCMEKRNQYLVEHSSVCVAFMKNARSGTSQTVRMARERGLTVINLAER